MKTSCSVVVSFAVSALLLAGCVESTSRAVTSPSPASGITGTVVDTEGGLLTLRLADGQVQDFLIPDSAGNVVPDNVWQSVGRQCRVQIKEYMAVDPVGGNTEGAPQLWKEITKFEWL